MVHAQSGHWGRQQTNHTDQRVTQRSATCWFALQMPATSKAEPGGSHEPGTSSECPMWVAGTHLLEPSPVVSQNVCSQEAGSARSWTSSRHADVDGDTPANVLTAVPDVTLVLLFLFVCSHVSVILVAS